MTVPQKSLNGRVAIVTGGGTGLGAAISYGLAGRGAFVVVNYSRSAEEAVAVVEEIKRGGGEDAATGEIGDVYMMPEAGPSTSYFYIGAVSRRDEDGWESIGDMGHLDAEGFLFLADRRTDLIISGGANIYPAEVEAAIDSYHGVRASAVVGLPDDDLGARVHAIVESADFIDRDALLAYLGERLVRYKVPRTIEFVTGPLRDEAGKIRRSALRAARLDKEFTP